MLEEYLLDVLEAVGTNARRGRGELCLFRAQVGQRYSGGLMVVGRAVNGWTNTWPLELAESPTGRREILDKLPQHARDECPLDWVLESRNGQGYSTSASAFWRVTEAVARGLKLGDEASWPSHIVWTNLYKVSPAESGNPSGNLCAAQLEACRRLLMAEIALHKPHHILCLTGRDWFAPFVDDALPPEVRGAGRDPIHASGEVDGAALAVCPHPQSKAEAPIVEAALRAFTRGPADRRR